MYRTAAAWKKVPQASIPQHSHQQLPSAQEPCVESLFFCLVLQQRMTVTACGEPETSMQTLAHSGCRDSWWLSC